MSAEEGIAKYQTDHLFLLVGKNPLPNYVAAKLLGVRDKTRFYLNLLEGDRTIRRKLEDGFASSVW